MLFIKIWLAAIVVWPFVYLLFCRTMVNLRERSVKTVRKLYYDVGFLMVGTGGVGAALGITAQTNEKEFLVRFIVAMVLIFFGAIIILMNLDD